MQRTLLILTGTSNLSHKAHGPVKSVTQLSRHCVVIYITLKSRAQAIHTATETAQHQDVIVDKFRVGSTVS